MTKILSLLVIAILAAQICARPDVKGDAKKEADAAKDKAKEAANVAKAAEKATEDEAKKVVGDGEKVAKDCEEPVEKALKTKHHKHHPKGIVSGVASFMQGIGDAFFGVIEGLPF